MYPSLASILPLAATLENTAFPAGVIVQPVVPISF
jgi:hypothetical protein